MNAQQQKRRKISWGRWIIVVIALLVILASTILWIAENQGPWINILPLVIFTVLGVIIALFQWLFPISSDLPEKALVSQQSALKQDMFIHAPPRNIYLPTFDAPSLTEYVLPFNKTAYRSILGVPPPTDPRTIQQRESAVKAVYAKLIQPDITAIVLTGMGGVGKSTLASLVYRYAEEQRSIGKGPFVLEALWLKVDSASVTITDLAGTIFDALGKPLPDLSSLAPHNQAATLFNALNAVGGARLIVLDQFENLLDWQTGQALVGSPGIGAWLDAINGQPCTSRILLTSRPRPLGTGAYPPTYMQEYLVKGLAISEGIELLHKLGIHASEAELRLAVERCAGHAFALTLLASLLHNRNLSLSTFFKNLIYAQLWTGNVARNLLDYIYSQQLDQMQRQLLLAFSVYREPVMFDAACAIVDDVAASKAQLHQAFDALLAQHLLQSSGDGLYRLHAIVTSYAHEHFDASNEQANRLALVAAHTRAAQYYQQYAKLHCPPRDQRRRRSDVQPLVEVVWQYCQAQQWQEAYAVIMQENLNVDLQRWGSGAVLLELYQLLLPLEKWQPEPTPAQKARISNDLGDLYRSSGQMKQARAYFEQALAICREVENRKEEGWALNNIGRIYANEGHKQQALEYYWESLDIHREVGGLGGESTVLTNIGWVYYDFGQMDKARDYYEQALKIRRTIGDVRGEGAALNSLGRVYANLQQREEAREYHEHALRICREIGDRGGEGWTLNNLGRVYADMGESKQAIDYFKQALEIRREIGNRGGEGSTLNNLGWVTARLGEKRQALVYYEQALVLRREVGNRDGECKTINSLGMIHYDLGQYEQASFYFRHVILIRRAFKQFKGEARTLTRLGLCYKQLERNDRALACFLLAKEMYENLPTLDSNTEQRAAVTEHAIREMHLKIGDEPFTALLAFIEVQKVQTIEQALSELSSSSELGK